MRHLRTISIALTLTALLAGSGSADTPTITGSGGAVTTTGTGSTGVSISAASGYPDVGVTTGSANTSSAFHVFNSGGTELLRVRSDGNVGIGTPSPDYPLDISANSALPLRITGTNNPGFVIANGGTTKFVLGIPTAAGNFIANSSVNDVALRASGGRLLFSTSATGATNDLTLSGGSVGIGTASPGAKLDVYGSARYGYGFATMPIPLYGGIQIGEYGAGGAGELQFLSTTSGSGYGFRFRGTSANGALLLERRWSSSTWADFMSFTDQGVGIGSTSATGLLQIGPTGSIYTARFSDTLTSLGIPNGVLLDMAGNSEVHIGGLRIGQSSAPIIETMGAAGVSALYLNYNSDNDVMIGNSSYARGLKVLSTGVSTFAGSVTVTGDITMTGNINAKYQDVAEWVPSGGRLAPGTVVSIDRAKKNEVIPSSHSYDTSVAGVVSEKPGVLLGVEGDTKSQIATTGRVRVHVDATSHPIAAGDLLVTSGKPGMAMCSEPVDLGGIKIHRPGTIIGKALEPLRSGEGDILVLLSLQ
jgi:hypothetical protein